MNSQGIKNKIYVPKQPAINSGACICAKRLFYRSIVQDLGFCHGSITKRKEKWHDMNTLCLLNKSSTIHIPRQESLIMVRHVTTHLWWTKKNTQQTYNKLFHGMYPSKSNQNEKYMYELAHHNHEYQHPTKGQDLRYPATKTCSWTSNTRRFSDFHLPRFTKTFKTHHHSINWLV